MKNQLKGGQFVTFRDAEVMNELSLFSGYGGFSLGLRLAGLQTRTVAYVEWEKYPQEIIKARIKDKQDGKFGLDDAPIFSDISSFRGEQFRGLVDIITAGFPCQPHSVAGLQRGADDDRNKWPDTLRVIREVEPRWVILENVPGLLSASVDGGRPAYGGTVVGELATLGYSVHWQTLGADDVGAPHRRKRWWCIGVANSEGERYRGGSSTERGDGERFVQSEEQGRSEMGSETEGRRGELADSGYEGLEGGIRNPGGEERQTSEEIGYNRDRVRSEAGCGDGTLADSNNERLEGIGANGHQAGWQEPDGSVGLPSGAIPVWPPSPNDTDGWEWVIRERPDLSPALTKEAESQFRGVDDGRSRRVDELKALGNGIVPTVLAEFLQRRLNDESPSYYHKR
jgi:DNA (cytosine-5)-methyltransferase 1